jgi:aromatic ring-opening dioxygenase catalytic subunit (LigB family)
MAEILGLGCSHGPIILTPPEVWAKGRERLFNRVPDYQPPPQLLEELGQDNGLSQDRLDHQRVVESFRILHDRLHQWNPDVVMIIGDDQAENFKEDNLSPFCIYTGETVDGYPFQRPAARTNLWNGAPETKFTFRCAKPFARAMRNHLIRGGFDLASSSALQGWEWGLAHAHINPLVFLDPDGKFPLLPFFVNCYGEEAGPDYPPRPTPRRCYELGQGIRQFLDTRSERVAVVASSSWSHSFLAHKFQCREIDIAFDRRNLEWVSAGQGSKLADLSPEELQQSGDHELLNWIIALGIIGDRPAEIVDVRESHTQLAFRVAAVWH